MKFWKNNRLDQEFEMHPEKVLDKFLKSKEYRDWLEGHNFDRSLRIFLTSKEGLFATFEKGDYDKLADYIFKNHESRKRTLAIFNFV